MGQDAGKIEAFLGVENSILGQKWVKRPVSGREAEALAAAEQIPVLAAEVILGRGVDVSEARSFLSPTLKEGMPNPSVLKDMDRAADRLADAVIRGEMIAVFGDYDVDGATSTAVVRRYLAALGARSGYYIPDRMAEGYGPNTPALLKLGRDGAKVIVTVDCGTLSYEPLAAAHAAGLDVIVIDHHKAEPALPQAYAVVNPNRLDCDSGLGYLAAVGVSFMLVVALNRSLRAKGYFVNKKRPPDIVSLLDMVALGTVCDVVPLVGVNRIFVSQGLKILSERQNIGLRALADVARIDEKPNTYHLGFLLGPRINAGGRVGQSSLGTRLLTTEDPLEAQKIAEQLDAYNSERKQIEAEVQEAAIRQVEARLGAGGTADTLLLAASTGWHAGVIGIVASRLKDKYGVPAIVIACDGGEAKGSCRSITGVDIGASIIKAVHKGLLLKGGGHAMAAGLTAHEDQLQDLEAFLKEDMRADVAAARRGRQLALDGLVAPSGVTANLVEAVECASPFGVGNPGPRFALEYVTLTAADRVGADHVRCRFKGRDGTNLKVMAFRVADDELGQILLTGIGRQFHIAGKLKKDDWAGGDKAEMTLEDAFLIGLP